MIDDIHEQFKESVDELRALCEELSIKYPKIQAFKNTTDPDVNIILESFALLHSKIKQDIHDNAIKLPYFVLESVYPELFACIPSTNIVYIKPNNIQQEMIVTHHTEVITIISSIEYKFHTVGSYIISRNNILNVSIQNIRHKSYTKMLCINLQMHQILQSLDIYIDSQNTSLILASIFYQQSKQDVYIMHNNILHKIGYIQMKDMPPICNVSTISQYYPLYNYAVMERLYHFVEIHFTDAKYFQSNTNYELLIPINNSQEMNIDTNMFKLNCMPIVNLYYATSQPVSIEVPEQYYTMSFNDNELLNFVQSISIYDNKSNNVIEYDNDSDAYFVVKKDNHCTIYLSKFKIQWTKLHGSMIYCKALCSNQLPMHDPVKTIVGNISSDTEIIYNNLHSNHVPLSENFDTDDYWRVYSILDQQILSLNNKNMLKKIISIAKVYGIDLHNIFTKIQTYDSYYLYKDHKSSWSVVSPKKVIEITVITDKNHFILYLMISKMLMNLASLEYALEVQFVDHNQNLLYRNMENID